MKAPALPEPTEEDLHRAYRLLKIRLPYEQAIKVPLYAKLILARAKALQRRLERLKHQTDFRRLAAGDD